MDDFLREIEAALNASLNVSHYERQDDGEFFVGPVTGEDVSIKVEAM